MAFVGVERRRREYTAPAPAARTLALEIYTRSLTGPVTKSSAAARAAYLATHYPALAGPILAAAGSEGAFDAAVSALAMARQVADLAALPVIADERLRREGILWHPGGAREGEGGLGWRRGGRLKPRLAGLRATKPPYGGWGAR